MDIEQKEISNLELGIYYVFIAESENPKAISKELKHKFWKGLYKFKIQKTSNPELVHSVVCVRTDLSMYDDYGIIVVQHNRPITEAAYITIPDFATAVRVAHHLEDQITTTTPITVINKLKKPEPKPKSETETVIVRYRRKYVPSEENEEEREEEKALPKIEKKKTPEDIFFESINTAIEKAYYEYIIFTGKAPSAEKLRKLLSNFPIPNTIELSANHSKLDVGKNCVLTLPDYEGRHFYLPPLHYTLYVLFLRHPEGIVLKQLTNYTNELIQIYNSLDAERDRLDAQQSIANMVDLTTGSAVQKISYIKRAFIKHVGPILAPTYSITGQRGGVYSIRLARDLVILPENLLLG